MRAIRVKNIRSIEDSGIIELSPITVVVGKNSCGKSSLIRVFPLLKQTFEKKVSEPILWYGDFVDYGDFNSVLTRGKKGNNIEIYLELSNGSSDYYYLYDAKLRDIKINAVISAKNLEKIKIQFADQEVEIFYKDPNLVEKIIINGEDNIISCSDLATIKVYSEFIPSIYLREKQNPGRSSRRMIEREPYINLLQILKQLAGNNTKQENIEGALYRKDLIGSKEEILQSLKDIKFTSSVLNERINKLSIESDMFCKINNYCVGSGISKVIEMVNASLRDEIKNISYVKPIRAMVDRFYRVQGINVDELDSDGSNLPMILLNMSKSKTVLKEFEQWSFEKFGIVFSVTNTEGHVSLVIKEYLDSKDIINMADTGYGYSQILPIILLLWMVRNHKINRVNRIKTIVIEQPELHLHPAFQAKLIDIFVDVIKEAREANWDIRIIFETHSETIINRLGYLVAKNQIDAESINVVVFNKEDGITQITNSVYKKNGALSNWPLGFFTPERLNSSDI